MSQYTNNKSNCGAGRDADRRSSDEIKHDIDRTLAEMDSTVNQLQNKMTFRGIVSELTGTLGDSGGAGAIARKVPGRVYEAAKANPVPAALLGLGVAWLVVDRLSEKGRHEGYEVGRGRDTDWLSPGAEYFPGRTSESHSGSQGPGLRERIGERAHDLRDSGQGMLENVKDRASGAFDSVKDRVSGMGHSMKDRVSGLGSSAKDRVSHLTGQVSDLTGKARERLHDYSGIAQEKAVQLKHKTEDLYEQTPLAFGAAALAVGIVGGLLIPATRREEELMGEASEKLRRKAKELGETALHQGQQMAQSVVGSIKQDVLGDTPVAEKVKEVAHKVIQTGKEQVTQGVQSLRNQGSQSNSNQGSQGFQSGSFSTGRQDQSQTDKGMGSCDVGGTSNVD